MSARVRTVLLAVVAMVAAACTTGAPLADVIADAGTTVAPPADARLVDAGYPQVAAWVRDEIARTGKPVVVTFFASWCGPCKKEMPLVAEVAAAHPEITVVGIDHQDNRAKAQAFVKAVGGTALPTLFDVEGETARAMGAVGMPATAFINTDGRVVYTHTGPVDRELLTAWIAYLTGQGPRPAARPGAPVPSVLK